MVKYQFTNLKKQQEIEKFLKLKDYTKASLNTIIRHFDCYHYQAINNILKSVKFRIGYSNVDHTELTNQIYVSFIEIFQMYDLNDKLQDFDVWVWKTLKNKVQNHFNKFLTAQQKFETRVSNLVLSKEQIYNINKNFDDTAKSGSSSTNNDLIKQSLHKLYVKELEFLMDKFKLSNKQVKLFYSPQKQAKLLKSIANKIQNLAFLNNNMW
ncbi:hypothetical protein ACJA23_00775 [Mycoplasma corogypsi]|uniref:hypothetical protein n=1 Tax=Mycoplasma corogypsi TaxID=2106 RepID=UPI0038739C3A